MADASPDLLGKLAAYHRRAVVPLHMPGHKQNLRLAPYLGALGAAYDITEIAGFDDLHQPRGVLKQSMEQAARLWGSDHAYFLVNGSTCGILAAIHAATKRGDAVLVARNCHQSVYHAIALCDLRPHFLLPPVDPSFDMFGSLPPQQVEQALRQHPDLSLIILTSPTYDGVVSDVPAICAIAHERNIPVLVDEAHGAHFGFSSGFPSGAVQSGADLVIQSLHKTLPSLTQTAIAHLTGPRISPNAFAHGLRMFETSSPSYLLLASIAACIRLIEAEPALFSAWEALLSRFDRQIASLRRFQVLCHGADCLENHAPLFQFDPGKLLISTAHTPFTGSQLMDTLRHRFDIELEMAAPHTALAMTGLGTTEAHLDRLAAALTALEQEMPPQEASAPPGLMQSVLPQQVLSPAKALSAPHRLVSADAAAGRVCGEYIWTYPPGIPFVIPGERLEPALLARLTALRQQGVIVSSTSGALPNRVEVLEGPCSDAFAY